MVLIEYIMKKTFHRKI